MMCYNTTVCCAFQSLVGYAKGRVDQICRSRNGRTDTGHFVQEFLRSSLPGILTISCRQLNSSDRCHQLAPDSITTLDKLMSSQVPAQPYTPIFALLEISRRLESPG